MDKESDWIVTIFSLLCLISCASLITICIVIGHKDYRKTIDDIHNNQQEMKDQIKTINDSLESFKKTGK